MGVECMSYGIVRVQKFGAGSVKGIEIHDRREKDHSHTNKEIDFERSKDNFDLHENEGSFYKNVKERIEQLDLKRAVRKDAVVMAQALVTSDKTFFDKLTPEQTKEFFKESYEFLKERYGKENVISATVHMDERTPHMHFNFVPVTQDGRLSAKTILNRTDLIKQHDDFYKEIGRKWGLSRGEKEGYKKHLEVAEYKKQTAYKEVEVLEKRLNELEKVDKSVNLHAEKGKLTYSTKEVEAIKDQNKALKVEIHSKGREIDKLKNEVSELQKGLSKAQTDLKKTEVPLERLKDLESENKALQAYVEKRPGLQKDMTSFQNRKENAYIFGNRMVDLKNKYEQVNQDRRQSVEKTYKLDNRVRECDSSITDLKGKQERLNATQGKIEGLESELEHTTGFFKGKDRKALQEQIDRERASLKEQADKLKLEYNIEPAGIRERINLLQDKKQELGRDRQAQIEHTNKCELTKKTLVQEYKFTKALSDTQDKGFREISTRHDARANLPIEDERLFRISHKDRAGILDRMTEQFPNNVERCKANFNLQDEQQKAMPKVMDKSQEWGLER